VSCSDKSRRAEALATRKNIGAIACPERLSHGHRRSGVRPQHTGMRI
jgi:hypothetical protein